MLKNINIDKLKIIISLYSTQSLSRTAQELYVSASAISQSLDVFEHQIGQQLFIKNGKKLVPTVYCKELIQVVNPLIENLNSFISSPQNAEPQIRGEVRLFLPGVAGAKVLADPISDFLKKHPQVSLSLDSGSAARALKELHMDAFDFAICGLKKLILQNKWAHYETLFSLNMNLYCSKDYFHQHKRHIHNKRFEELVFVSGYKTQFMLDWFFKEVYRRKFTYKSQVSVYDMNFMTKCVLNGLGLGLLAEELISEDLDKLVKINTKPLIHPLFLVSSKNRKLSHLEKQFKHHLMDYFKSLSKG